MVYPAWYLWLSGFFVSPYFHLIFPNKTTLRSRPKTTLTCERYIGTIPFTNSSTFQHEKCNTCKVYFWTVSKKYRFSPENLVHPVEK